MKWRQSKKNIRPWFELQRFLLGSCYAPALILLVVCSLASCTKLTYHLIYTKIDLLFIRQMDQYFQIDQTQEELLKKDFKQVMLWHKANQLPRYLALIATTRKALQTKFAANQLSKIINELVSFRNKTYYKLEPSLLGFILTLSDEQIKYFENKIQTENKETYENNFSMSLKDQNHQRRKRMISNLEKWFGKLNAKEKKQIKDFIKNHPNAALSWFNESKQNKKNLIHALRNKLPKKVIYKKMRFLCRIYESLTLGRRTRQIPPSEKWTKDAQTFTVIFIQGLTTKQKIFINNELNELEKNIQYLIKN